MFERLINIEERYSAKRRGIGLAVRTLASQANCAGSNPASRIDRSILHMALEEALEKQMLSTEFDPKCDRHVSLYVLYVTIIVT